MKTHIVRHGFLIAALVCLVELFVAPAVSARQVEPTVSLLNVSPFVNGNDDLNIELQVTGAAATDSVRVAIFRRATRQSLRRIVDGQLVPTIIDYATKERRLSELLDPTRTSFVLKLANADLPRTAGVYPMQIRVGTSKPITTWLVRTAPTASGDHPYTLSVVLPVQARNMMGTTHTTVSADDMARIASLAEAIQDAPPNSFTVSPSPETLDALDAGNPDDARATLLQLQTALAGTTVLSAPFVPIDIDAWHRAGRDDIVAAQLQAGRDIAARTLARSGESLNRRTAILDRTTTADSLNILRADGATQVVASESQLEPLKTDTFPSPFAQLFRLRDSTNQELLAASTDTWLTNLMVNLKQGAAGSEQTQQIIADLAVAFFDKPTLSRGSIVVLPDNWSPSSRFIDNILKPLASSSIITLRDVDSFFQTVARSSPEREGEAETLISGVMRRTLVPIRGADVSEQARTIDATRNKMASYRSLFGTDVSDRLKDYDTLLLASVDDRLSDAERASYISAITNFIESSLRAPDGRAALAVPESERITLTARRATIRLSIENRLSVPANVRIDLRAEKLDFPNGATIATTLAPGPNTVTFDVRTKASGDSLLEYSINAPDGSLGQLAAGKLRVRYFALSGLGVVISAIAVIVLATWWIRHVLRDRRRTSGDVAEALQSRDSSAREPAKR